MLILGQVGTNWEALGCIGMHWDALGRVGTCWEPNKLHDFDIQKNLSGKKERRKKKNIGYRVASNERRLKKLENLSKTQYIFRF